MRAYVQLGVFAAAGLWCMTSCRALAAESVLDNGRVTVTAKPGAPAVVLSSKGAGGAATRVELALCGTSVSAIGNVSAKGPESMRVSAGGVDADFSVERGQPFVTVTPSKPDGFLEVRAASRYAALPDFFGYDVVYDPTRFKGETLAVPAENFLLNFVEGNRAIVVCAWPGTLTGAKKKGDAGLAADRAQSRDPAVSLSLQGDGAGRRIAAWRVEFVGGPIHVAVLEHDNIWHDEDVSGFKPLEPTKLEWKRPFDAHWRLDTLVAEGKKSKDLISRSQSYRFIYAPAPEELKGKKKTKGEMDIEDKRAMADRTGRIWTKGYPVAYEEGIYSHIYSAWFKDADTYVALYADNPRKGGNEKIYDRILIYPIDRDKASPKQTPIDVHTFVDIMRATLGQEPCAYVLDLEGVKSRGAGGDQQIVDDATCSIWGGHISPVIGKKELSDEERANLVRAVKDLTVFLKAVNVRIEEYAVFNEKLQKAVGEAKNVGDVKAVADRIGAIATAMKAMLDKYGAAKFKQQVEQWDKTIAEVVAKIEAGDHGSARKLAPVRNLGQDQDNAVSDCRRYVKAIRQEASFIESGDPEVQKFSSDIRDMCQQILRNAHPKELGHTDPNSPRIGLTREQR